MNRFERYLKICKQKKALQHQKIYISTKFILNYIILEKHNISFFIINDKNMIEKEYNYSKKYKINNNNFIIYNIINTPIKIIISNINCINGLKYNKLDKNFK